MMRWLNEIKAQYDVKKLSCLVGTKNCANHFYKLENEQVVKSFDIFSTWSLNQGVANKCQNSVLGVDIVGFIPGCMKRLNYDMAKFQFQFVQSVSNDMAIWIFKIFRKS